jgi:putative acetyltransferase
MAQGYERVSQETGAMTVFEAARSLYRKFGFCYREPFADKKDPNSVFMTKTL